MDNLQPAHHPMVDGANTEYEALQVEPISISEGVNLYFFQNESYVWISYDYPEGSYGATELTITTETIVDPLVLHISAQLGEWFEGDQENIPTNANSDLWWNMKGWIANPLWANGIDTESNETPEYRIKNGDMREIQLSKQRFGRGIWHIQLDIQGIQNSQGEFRSVLFPEKNEFYTIRVH